MKSEFDRQLVEPRTIIYWEFSFQGTCSNREKKFDAAAGRVSALF